MNCSKLDEILSIVHSKDNKRKLTKEEKNTYTKEIKCLLSENEFGDEIIHYIIAGPQYIGFKGYMEWYHTVSYEEQINTIEKLLTNKIMYNLPAVKHFRNVLILLSDVISKKEINNVVVGQLLSWLDELSYTKEGKRIGDLGKIFKSCFFATCRLETIIPAINTYGFTEEYESRLYQFFEEVFSSIEIDGSDEKKKLALLRKWLLSNEINENSKNTETKDISNSESDGVSGKFSYDKEEVIETANEKTNNKEKNEENTISITGKTATKIFELAQIVDVMESVANELSKEVKKKEKRISSLQVQLNNSVEKNKSLELENAELRGNIINQQNEIEIIKKESMEMSARIERQSSVLDVFQEDKENSQAEQLNSLAASLVRLYKEFEVAQSMELNTDLEMTLLDLIEDIFRKLEKNGVDVKGRM